MRRRHPQFPGRHKGKVRFYEYRTLTWTAKRWIAVIVVGAGFGILEGLWTGEPLWEFILVSSGVVGFCALLVLLILKTGMEHQHIRVDDAGLWVGKRPMIPRARILDAIPLSHDRAATMSSRYDWQGIPIDVRSLTYYRRLGDAEGQAVLVIVEPKPAEGEDGTQGLLIATKNAEGLANALRKLAWKRDGRSERRPQAISYGADDAFEHQHHHRPRTARQRRKQARRRRRDLDGRRSPPDQTRPPRAS